MATESDTVPLPASERAIKKVQKNGNRYDSTIISIGEKGVIPN